MSGNEWEKGETSMALTRLEVGQLWSQWYAKRRLRTDREVGYRSGDSASYTSGGLWVIVTIKISAPL